jgi:hypothetical protein
MAHATSNFVSQFFNDARHLGYQGELEIISFLILMGLAAGACGLAAILLIYCLW